MILNRVNYENEKEKIKKKEKENQETEEIEEEKEEEEEEIDYEDSHKRKMIRNTGDESEKENIISLQYKIFYYKIFSIILVVLVLLIVLIIIFRNSRKKEDKLATSLIDKVKENEENNETISDNNQNNTETKENIEDEKNNKIINEIKNLYNKGEINIIKFFEEKINEKTYSLPDNSMKTNVHINIGFNENNIDTIIKHLSSALYHANQSTFLHIHMMDADTFGYDSLIKLKNMIYKINNNTEVIVYNASQVLKDFSIKEGSSSTFSKEYAKLYAFKAIKSVQKIIFLDADDCMVEKDLSELYNLDMNNIYIRGISEEPSIKYPVDWLDKYLLDKSHYINGGVVLVNLELSQMEDFYNKAIELNNNEFYTKTEDPVQDILNVLMRKKIEFFHPRYNKINFYENTEDKNDESKWYSWITETLKICERNNHFYTKEELIQADNNPVIIHYQYDNKLNKVVKKYEEDKSFYAKLVGI